MGDKIVFLTVLMLDSQIKGILILLDIGPSKNISQRHLIWQAKLTLHWHDSLDIPKLSLD